MGMNQSTVLLLRRWWLLPVLLIVTAGSVATNLSEHGPASAAQSVLAVAFAVVAAATLFAVDRWPLTVVVSGSLVGGYFVVGGENGPIFFVLIVAAFLLAERRPVATWWPFLLGSAGLVWLGLVVRGLRWDELNVGLWQAAGVGALVAAAAAVATALRSRAEARDLDRRRAATEEQLRMAQDLHDGVGHGLAVIAMQSGVALHVLDRDAAAARASLEAIRETSRESLEALRVELSQMTGQTPAPRSVRPGLEALDALVDRIRAGGLAVAVRDGTAGEAVVRDEVGETAYAIVQEALTNVLRHADASTVTVDLIHRDGALEVTVVDDGRGGDVHDEGMGLTGMRERAARWGGRLEAGPGHDGGFRIHAVLPVGLA